MKCPYCENESRVVDSRPIADGIRRRRECIFCGRRFTTHERIVPLEIRVMKARGRPSEDFDMGKIIASMQRVCKKSPVGLSDIKKIARSVETKLVDSGRLSVTSIEIAAIALEHLRTIDEAAAGIFAANYQNNPEATHSSEDEGDVQQYRLFD